MKFKKIKYVLPIILALALLMSFSQVHATTYYNWVQNSGFEAAVSSQIPDYSFESGEFNAANWTAAGTTYLGISNNYVHTGSYACVFGGGVTGATLTNDGLNIPIINIAIFGFWGYNLAGSHAVDLDIHTTNGTLTYNFNSNAHDDGVWYYWDCLSLLSGQDSTVNITSVVFDVNSATSGGGYQFWLDDVLLSQSTIDQGQTTVSSATIPWFNIDLLGWNDADGIATSGLAHSGICAYYYAGDTGYTGTFYLYQSIPMLLTNFVENCSFWAYESTAGCSVKFHVVYGDGYQNIDTFSFDSVGIWQEFNVTILPNRVIETVALEFVGSSVAYPIYVDDVSLLAIVPYGQSCFTWYVSPPPISFNNWSFSTYISESHIFYGFVHAANDTICGSGSFSTTSTYGGVQSGTIVNGAFNFPISARTTLITDTVEDFIISIVTDVGNFTVTVKASWQYVYVEGSGGLPIFIPTLLNGILIFGILFAPPLIISVLVRKVKGDAMVGFIAGLSLSVIAGIIVKDSAGNSIVPLWGLFIITLVLAYCIFAKVREK